MRAILTYHSIDDSGSAISVPPDIFRDHMRWLAASPVAVVSLAQLIDLDAETDALALTFDDGFVNFGEVAWPEMREHGLPATLFVPTARVGIDNAWGDRSQPGIPTLPLLDWERLGQLAEDGLALGSHTNMHCDLRALGEDALEQELGSAVEQIRAHTGIAPLSFCYPYGAYDDRTVRAVGQLHSCACTTEMRPLVAEEPPLRLPRLDAYYLRTPGRLESWGSLGFRSYLWARAAARTLRQRWVGLAGTTR